MQSRVNFIELSGKFWPVECLGLNEDEKSTGGERKYLTSLRLTCLRLTEVGEAFERTSVTPFHLALPDRPYAKQFNNFQKNFLIKRQTVRRVRWKLQVIYWIYICLIIKETRVINWTSASISVEFLCTGAILESFLCIEDKTECIVYIKARDGLKLLWGKKTRTRFWCSTICKFLKEESSPLSKYFYKIPVVEMLQVKRNFVIINVIFKKEILWSCFKSNVCTIVIIIIIRK